MLPQALHFVKTSKTLFPLAVTLKTDAKAMNFVAYPGQRYVCDESGEMYDLFPQGVHGGRWVGEDFAFCRLWREIGGEMWVQCNISFTHAGRHGNFMHYLQEG